MEKFTFQLTNPDSYKILKQNKKQFIKFKNEFDQFFSGHVLES